MNGQVSHWAFLMRLARQDDGWVGDWANESTEGWMDE